MSISHFDYQHSKDKVFTTKKDIKMYERAIRNGLKVLIRLKITGEYEEMICQEFDERYMYLIKKESD